jgi:hypothetical protein
MAKTILTIFGGHEMIGGSQLGVQLGSGKGILLYFGYNFKILRKFASTEFEVHDGIIREGNLSLHKIFPFCS